MTWFTVSLRLKTIWFFKEEQHFLELWLRQTSAWEHSKFFPKHLTVNPTVHVIRLLQRSVWPTPSPSGGFQLIVTFTLGLPWSLIWSRHLRPSHHVWVPLPALFFCVVLFTIGLARLSSLLVYHFSPPTMCSMKTRALVSSLLYPQCQSDTWT